MMAKQYLMTCLVVCSLVLSVYAETDPELHESIEKCSKEHSISEEEIESFKKHEVLESDEAKCFLKCVAKVHFNFFSDGTYNHDDVVAHIKENHEDAEEMLETLEKCKEEIKSEDGCEAALELYNCWIKYDTEPINGKDDDTK